MYQRTETHKGTTDTKQEIEAGGFHASHYKRDNENSTDTSWVQIYARAQQASTARQGDNGNWIISTEGKTTHGQKQEITLCLPETIVAAILTAHRQSTPGTTPAEEGERAAADEWENTRAAKEATASELLAAAADRQAAAAKAAAENEAAIDEFLTKLFYSDEDLSAGWTLPQFLAAEENRDNAKDTLDF